MKRAISALLIAVILLGCSRVECHEFDGKRACCDRRGDVCEFG